MKRVLLILMLLSLMATGCIHTKNSKDIKPIFEYLARENISTHGYRWTVKQNDSERTIIFFQHRSRGPGRFFLIERAKLDGQIHMSPGR